MKAIVRIATELIKYSGETRRRRISECAAAAEAYTAFLRAHSQADDKLPELKEARDYLSQTASLPQSP